MTSPFGPAFKNLSPLRQCVEVSRALGSDPALVLHGGGNTSVKDTVTDVTGRPVDVVHVKGSGWDLATIEEAGFAPLRRERLLELSRLEHLDDTIMVNELRQASLNASAPTASIEAILHALIPFRTVLHSHADAIVALGDQPGSRNLVRSVLGEDVLVIDYVKPGFDLARTVARAWETVPDPSKLEGIVLLKHGLFTFSDDAETAYLKHLELVEKAKASLGGTVPRSGETAPAAPEAVAHAALRASVSRAAGRPMILQRRDSATVERLERAPGFPEITQRGTITPEHVIRTKRLPCVGADVEAYAEEYLAYVERHSAQQDGDVVALDPAPRVILGPETGLITAGETVQAARIAADIYEHTAQVILWTEAGGGYTPISEAEAFAIEYWELEQAKLRKASSEPPFTGEVALVTGAASGIGRACALKLMELGAAVIALDRSPAVAEVSSDPRWLGLVCDVTEEESVVRAVEEGVLHFGGLDLLVPAAGVFAASAPIDSLPRSAWDLSMGVNVNGLFSLFQVARKFLALAPRGGRVVLIASKNVPAPGPGAAAYSASKAAATQLARVAALEWAKDRITVNMVNPDAVFDTGLWTPELLAERAAKYGLSIEDYKRRNLLRTEVTSRQVATVVSDLCRGHYSATTGAQLPIDGGSDRIV